jgi:hypothetical protein
MKRAACVSAACVCTHVCSAPRSVPGARSLRCQCMPYCIRAWHVTLGLSRTPPRHCAGPDVMLQCPVLEHSTSKSLSAFSACRGQVLCGLSVIAHLLNQAVIALPSTCRYT